MQPPSDQIILLRPAVRDPEAAARALSQALELKVRHVYFSALSGFAASVPAARLDALKLNPMVAWVEPDTTVKAADAAPAAGRVRWRSRAAPHGDAGPCGYWGPEPSKPSAPERPALQVAVLDTGIDGEHPFLKEGVAQSCSFIPGAQSSSDDNGHGTHVAGIIMGQARLLAPPAKDGQPSSGVQLVSVKVMSDGATGPSGRTAGKAVPQCLRQRPDRPLVAYLAQRFGSGGTDLLVAVPQRLAQRRHRRRPQLAQLPRRLDPLLEGPVPQGYGELIERLRRRDARRWFGRRGFGVLLQQHGSKQGLLSEGGPVPVNSAPAAVPSPLVT